jgi:hypothetical protein
MEFMKKFLTNLFLNVFIFLIVAVTGFYLGKIIADYLSPVKNEFYTQVIHSVQFITKVSAYKIHNIEELEWDNSITEKNEAFPLMNKIANFFYLKKLKIIVPITATYGIDIDSANFQAYIQKDTLFMNIPKAKLLFFEVKWNQKKMYSEKGILEFENDHQFDDLEKLFYQNKFKLYQKNHTAIAQSQKMIEQQLISFYKNLGYELKFCNH